MTTTDTNGARPPIVVYSGPLCSGCEEVKAYLAAHDLAYEERNIRGNIETMIEFRRKGYDILPVIEVGDQVISEYKVGGAVGNRLAGDRLPELTACVPESKTRGRSCDRPRALMCVSVAPCAGTAPYSWPLLRPPAPACPRR